MKRNINLIFFIFIFSLFFVSAQVENLENLQNFTNNLPSDADSIRQKASDYIKQEWDTFLEKYQIGKMILFVSDIFKALSPLFKIFIGFEYSLSLVFFLSLGVWLSAIIIIYKPMKEIFEAKKWIALLIAIIIPTIATQTGTIKLIINFLTPLWDNPLSIIFSIFIAILLLLLYGFFISLFSKKFKRDDEKRREEKAKLVEKLHDIEIKANK